MEYVFLKINLETYIDDFNIFIEDFEKDLESNELQIVRHQYSYDNYGYSNLYILLKGENANIKIKNLISSKYNYMNNPFSNVKYPEIEMSMNNEDLKQKCLDIFEESEPVFLDNEFNWSK